MSRAHRCNAPGPFYVEDGCCLACGVPFLYAPEAFEWQEGESHCFVARQPEDPEAVDRMVQALWGSEVECIRYRGDDPAILRRLAEMDAGDRSDVPVPALKPVRRHLASFRSPNSDDTAELIAERFRLHLLQAREWPPYTVRRRRPWRPATVVFSWMTGWSRLGRYHRVRFKESPSGGFRLRIRSGYPPALEAVALLVHEWLRDDELAREIVWSSAEDPTGASRLHLPF